MQATLRTLDNYLAVALLEAEYWGTDSMSPDFNPDTCRLYGLLLVFPDQDEISKELIAQYIPEEEYQQLLDQKHRPGGAFLELSYYWLIIAADLEQRINNVDEAYFA